MILSKDQIRRNAMAHRKRLAPSPEVLDKFAANFQNHIPLSPNDIIALYMPLGSEFDVKDLGFLLMEKGHQLCLPRVEVETRRLSFYPWTKETDFIKSQMNILEPVIDPKEPSLIPTIVVCPLLAFDQKGYRLGYGGGYYDATLSALREKSMVTSIGVGYAEQACLFNLPREDHDQRLDWIVTSEHVFHFDNE